MELIDRLNEVLNSYGYVVLKMEDLDELKNMVQSLTDYINVKEGEEK